MISIYKNDIGNIVMVFTDEDRKRLKSTLPILIEELQIVASGDVTTNEDAERCEDCLKYIIDTFGELLDKKEPEKKSAKDLAAKYSEPMIYRHDTDEYRELESLEGDDWVEFLDELARYGLSCRFNNAFDCFTIG